MPEIIKLPAFKLLITQFMEQKDAAVRLERLKDHMHKLWGDAKRDVSVEQLNYASRTIQDEIFEGRRKNPLIFDWVFKMFRGRHEQEMQYSTAQYVDEARQKLGLDMPDANKEIVSR